MRLEQGKQQSLPVLPIGNATCLVYVFDGSLAVNENINIQKGESLVVENEEIRLKAVGNCNIVLFVTDRHAKAFDEGMYSGNFINLFSSKKYKLLMLKPSPEYLSELSAYAEKGITIVVSKVYPFHSFEKAFVEVSKGKFIGKAVITMDGVV